MVIVMTIVVCAGDGGDDDVDPRRSRWDHDMMVAEGWEYVNEWENANERMLMSEDVVGWHMMVVVMMMTIMTTMVMTMVMGCECVKRRWGQEEEEEGCAGCPDIKNPI
eukprot:3158002-Pyramimonas_sp.AAC.1